jgi:hypothetical protein
MSIDAIATSLADGAEGLAAEAGALAAPAAALAAGGSVLANVNGAFVGEPVQAAATSVTRMMAMDRRECRVMGAS